MHLAIRTYYLLSFAGLVACSSTGCSENFAASDVSSASAVEDNSVRVPPVVDGSDESGTTDTSEAEVAVDPDEELAEAFLGTWELHDRGLRTVVVNPDGTASMHIQLDFIPSLIYGEEMTMDLEWQIEDGVLSYSIVRGQPEDSVQRVISDYGSERSYRVIHLSDDHIKLEDLAFPGSFYDWKSIGPAPDQG